MNGAESLVRTLVAGGVNALMCDGEVRVFSDTIEREVWRALATRSGPQAEPRGLPE